MYDVIFVTPNDRGRAKDEVIGSLQMATILKQNGISCELLPFFSIGDLKNFDDFINNAMAILAKDQPKIVSFYTRCDMYHIDLRLAEKIKSLWPNVYVVFGGPQSDIVAEETIKQIPYVDFVCRGEGETTIYPLFSSILKGNPDLSVPGLVYRDGDQVISNPRPALIEDLDALPMVDYSLLKIAKKEIDAREVFSINVGRGCPFGCTFCSTKSFWGRKFRLKSPQRICQEIQVVHDLLGFTRFNLAHDMFTFNRKLVSETCRLIKALDFPIEWGCSARLDCIDKEMIDEMADSGMVGIYIGIETGSERMQKLINKRLKLTDAVEKIAYLKSKGIRTTASFIYGFPEENEEDISHTISLIGKLLKLKTVDVQTHLCAFLAQTELAEKYRDQLTPTEQYSDHTGSFAIDECRDLIDRHPEMFSQLMEYKTPLRTKLRYFEIFIAMWNRLQPVYQYICEKYPENDLVQMYFDFVQANADILDEIELYSKESLRPLIIRDQFPKMFADDPNYDLMEDYCKFQAIKNSDAVRNGETVTEAFRFAPSSMKKFETLQEYPRRLSMVMISKTGYQEFSMK